MGFKKWWKGLEYWKKGVYIGALLGLIKIPLFVTFGERLPISVHYLFSKIPDEMICNLFKINEGESCGFFVLIYGFIYNPIFYAVIGGLLGFIYTKMIKK